MQKWHGCSDDDDDDDDDELSVAVNNSLNYYHRLSASSWSSNRGTKRVNSI